MTDQPNQTPIAQLSALVERLVNHYATDIHDIKEVMANGKGEWSKPGYITDSRWDFLRGDQLAQHEAALRACDEILEPFPGDTRTEKLKGLERNFNATADNFENAMHWLDAVVSEFDLGSGYLPQLIANAYRAERAAHDQTRQALATAEQERDALRRELAERSQANG